MRNFIMKVPLLNFEGSPGSQGPEVLVPLLHHAYNEGLFLLSAYFVPGYDFV